MRWVYRCKIGANVDRISRRERRGSFGKMNERSLLRWKGSDAASKCAMPNYVYKV